MLHTKSIHSAITPEDGLRILAARFRGRGVVSDRYDVWMANLGPSEELLRAFQDGELSFAVFGRRYKAELFSPAEVDQRNRTIQNRGQKFSLRLIKHLSRDQNLTLLCHCPEDTRECHRHLLQQVIESRKI